MLHLAQVRKNPSSGKIELQLLAQQKSKHIWGMSNPEYLPFDQENPYTEGLLVLVELSENGKIDAHKAAKDWILDLIQKYLINPSITPEFVQQEQEKVEEWRQEIALKSQDLTRRNLEIETRREQLQELEDKLKEEKEQLETRWEKLQELEEQLEQKKQ
ncbi:MAG: hypothetical protein F6K10_33595 [Moorea sp. SIO2B7]|nr:hypothetical protein [Moorena sp. SIO2B7]